VLRLQRTGREGCRNTIAAQFEEIGVAPNDIDLLVVSHAHYDHVGNCRLFPKARWIAQKAERDADSNRTLRRIF
jgi:glyoxylase-like metal-dependent hydrolase (beta-lactamase superfamily II)